MARLAQPQPQKRTKTRSILRRKFLWTAGLLTSRSLPAFYYYALVELHFIDADHLMFVFNTPGLLKRDDNCPGSEAQRMVHAVVLQLPSGVC